jgi:hypothetical protein
MTYPSCVQLVNLEASCDAVKKVGGIKSRFYIGQKPDIATCTFGTHGEITALTLASGKFLNRFEGVQYKNTGSFETIVNETRNLFNQTFTGILFYHTQTDLEAIEKILISDRLFVIAETESGEFKAYGIDKNPFNAADLGKNRGLNVSAGTGSDGVVLADNTGVTITLVGELYNPVKMFKPASTLAENETYLNGLLD